MRDNAHRSTQAIVTLVIAVFDGLTAARADCPPTECGPGSYFSINAVAVNGNPITPTNCVYVRPGDLIETELHISDWGAELPAGVVAYEAGFRFEDSAWNGTAGTVLPLGWDAPILSFDLTLCTTASDCPSNYPHCTDLDICAGPNHHPERGAFITTSRPDFMLFDAAGDDLMDLQTLHYRFAGLSFEGFGIVDTGVPRYAGTLKLVASQDACDAFELRFVGRNLPCDWTPQVVLRGFRNPFPIDVNPDLGVLTMHVCEDDGLFCNGVESCSADEGCTATAIPNCDDGNECTTDSCNEDTESCDHLATCGACCDSWLGNCDDGVAQAECNCTSCVWTGAAACDEVDCEAEFVPIPAVSQWGLVVLTLLLFTGAKLRFGRPIPLAA